MIRPRCLRIFFAAVFCFNLAVGLAIHAQAAGAAKIRPVKAGITLAEQKEPQLLPGVVVEKVERNSEAEKAGLREGDVLLSWSRGEFQGVLSSPFEEMWFNFQLVTDAPLVFEGYRGGAPRKWKTGFYFAGLSTRPNFGSRFLPRYWESLHSTVEIKAKDPDALWDRLATGELIELPTWLRSWFLLHAAEELAASRRWDESDVLYNAASRATQDMPDAKGLILAYWAKSFEVRQDLERAIKYYELALPATRLMASRKSVPESNPHVSGPSFCRPGIELQQLPRAEENIQTLSYPSGSAVSSILDILGSLNRERGNLEEAEKFFLQERMVNRQMDIETFYALGNLGSLAYDRGDIQMAERYFQAVLSSCRAGQANSLSGLSLISAARGDVLQAQRFDQRALAASNRWPRETRKSDFAAMWFAAMLGNLGALALDEGHYRTAMNYQLRALAIQKRAMPQSMWVVRTLTSLGEVLQKSNRLPEAENYLTLALELGARIVPNSPEYAWTLTDFGNFYLSSGAFDKAERFYRQSLAIRETLTPGRWEHAEVLALLGKTLQHKGQTKEALDFYHEALDMLAVQTGRIGGGPDARSGFRARHGGYYTDYVDLLVAAGRQDAAYSVLERSRARALLELLASVQIDLRNRTGPALLKREHSLQAEIKAKSDRRVQLMGEKHPDEQLKAIEDEISGLLLQQRAVDNQIRATSPAYAALTQPQPLTAKEVQSQLLDENTQLLEYSLGEERSYVFAVTPDSLQVYELPKRAVVEKAALSVYSLLTARNVTVKGETATQKQSRIALAEAQYPHAVAELSKMLLGPVAAQLQSKRLLVVTDGALAYIPFSVLPEPQNSPADVSVTASSSSSASSTPSSASSAASTTSAAATPLVVNHEIVNLPSASVLAVLRQQELGRKPAPKAVAVLADPVFDRHDARLSPKLGGASLQNISQTRSSRAPTFTDPLLDPPSSLGLLTRSAADVGLSRNGAISLPRLRFSRREAEEIMAVTPPGEGKEAVDFEASRATATSPELSQYRIVHFATHGLLDSVHPELSGLVFSMVDKNGRPQNGFLELQDIYNLNLPADLVVLSACETGLGKEISGEGLVGLTRGFMYAGASRVMASLWKVSDSGTAALMAEFYRAMEKDNLSPAAALRAAQIKMWQQQRWRNPYYWAAFQIQGEFK